MQVSKLGMAQGRRWLWKLMSSDYFIPLIDPAQPAIIQIPSLHYEFPNSFLSVVSSCGAELTWGYWKLNGILFASERCPHVSDKTEEKLSQITSAYCL